MPIRIDSRGLSVLVHDLRNPLNVIGLSLRMVEEELPSQGCEEARDDLRIVRENVALMTRMLAYLGDYARLIDLAPVALVTSQFDPRRLVAEVLDEVGAQSTRPDRPIPVEVGPDCPESIHADPSRARVALRYALINAMASAGESPIRIVLRGCAGGLEVEVAVDRPARATVQSMPIAGDRFERILGGEAERRGLDLAMAGGISELLGGGARLEVREGAGTSVVLSWTSAS